MDDWAFEIMCTGPADRVPDARAWLDAAVPAFKALPALTSLDLYRPIESGARDPFNDDGRGPLFIAMLGFSSRRALSNATSRGTFGRRPQGLSLTGACFERR